MEDKNKENILDELFTDFGSQIDPAELVVILRPFLRISRENNSVIFTPKGMELTANSKIILFILSRKVLFIRGILDQEFVAPKDIKQYLGKNIPSGTIDASLKRLTDKGLIKSENSRYFIPDFNFQQIREIFSSVH